MLLLYFYIYVYKIIYIFINKNKENLVTLLFSHCVFKCYINSLYI